MLHRAAAADGESSRSTFLALVSADPQVVTHAFHVVFGVLALHAAAGAFFAGRAPRIDLAGRGPAGPPAD